MLKYIPVDVDNYLQLSEYVDAIMAVITTGGGAHGICTNTRAGGERMDDVRKAAEERASRPRTAEVGASFESERQRSKNALVKQLDALDGRNVRKIAAAALKQSSP